MIMKMSELSYRLVEYDVILCLISSGYIRNTHFNFHNIFNLVMIFKPSVVKHARFLCVKVTLDNVIKCFLP